MDPTLSKMKHLMIDIETLNNKSNSVICSIAAVQFDIETGMTGAEFFETVDIESCLKLGLTVNGDTIKWWFSQDKEVQQALFKDTQSLETVLNNFRKFYRENEAIYPWGNGARFDLGLIEDAYVKLGQRIPWSYRNERDVRTLVSFSPNTRKEVEEKLFKSGKFKLHNPLDDCKVQIEYCTEIYNKIKI